MCIRDSDSGRRGEEPPPVEQLHHPLTPLDELYLQRAYELAARGIGSTDVYKRQRMALPAYHGTATLAATARAAALRLADSARGASVKAMILAGGLSTRLYPLTKSVPKPLVPVAGVPNAAHLMHYLKAYGFDEIAINVHYLADAIVEALGDGSRYGVDVYKRQGRLPAQPCAYRSGGARRRAASGLCLSLIHICC